MASISDVSALPPWARVETAQGAICGHGGHASAHPVKSVAVVIDWFGQSEGEVSIGWRRVRLPLHVCRRHLSKVQESWEKTEAQRRKVADKELSARDLKAALEYFRETTGLALDAGVTEVGRGYRFTLNAVQLRHLADDVYRLRQGRLGLDGDEEDPAGKALDNVIQFPGGRY